ncbi:MAG: glycosyltransferase family 2 protein [Candidatus Omnitrophota bacterium]|nr:glycosyltransferase family 2 protein [Candidatus Omnitrophota bacterium]
MKFSIIIPVHNARGTLKTCLDSVFSSENKDLEVFIVDDASTDESAQIVKNYPCKLITLEENMGAASARNIGKDYAKGDILVFIDSDVTIRKDTLDIIDKSFIENKELIAVTGIQSKDSPHKDFFSQYKSLYMNYIFKKCPKYVDFLHGSIIAVKKDYFLNFDETFKATDDTELGQRYKTLNKKILLNPELEVIHLKRYNFRSIVKNDFSVPFWWTKSFMLHKGYKDIFKKKRFAHARMSQLLSIPISLLILLFFMLGQNVAFKTAFFILLLVYMLLNFNFFAFLHRERGYLFLIKSAIFNYLDMLVMGLGISVGFLIHTFKMGKNEITKQRMHQLNKTIHYFLV